MLALAICACDEPYTPVINDTDDEELIEMGDPVTRVSATVEPYRFADGTRSTLVISADQMVHNWDNGDLVGFWPSANDVRFGPPSQARFVYTAPASSSDDAVLAACGWSLIRGKIYYSYYPYNTDAAYNSVPINFKYQRQPDNGSAAHLGEYDYLHASVTPPATGDIVMHYSPVCCTAHLALTIPEDYRTTRFTDMILSTSGNYLTTSATFNPSGTTPSISNQQKSDNFTVSLGPMGSDMACSSEGQLDVYCILCPGSDLKNKAVTVTLYGFDGETFTGTFTPTVTMQSGVAYNFNVNMSSSGPGRINLSRIEPANSYIVSAAGDYKFKSVKGCTDIAVTPASVKVFWETVNTSTAPAPNSLIKNTVNYQDGYIYFSTADTFKEGNALIAAYSGANGTGDILWSWHIWMTDAPADVVYPNNAGILQDRNLGALSTSGDLSTGLFFQWGRKDPFTGAIGLNKKNEMQVAGTASRLTQVNASTGTIAYATKHPNEFIGEAGTSNLDWIAANYKVGTDWQLANPDVEKSLWYAAGNEKTKYDPCPPGYRVPYSGTDGNENDFWGQALGLNASATSSRLTSGPNYANISINSNTISYSSGVGITLNLSNGVSVFYPASGYISEAGTRQNDGKHIMCWSNFPAGTGNDWAWNTPYGSCLDINMEQNLITFSTHYNSGRAAGKNVRCMKATSKMTPASPVDNEGFGNSPTPSPW